MSSALRWKEWIARQEWRGFIANLRKRQVELDPVARRVLYGNMRKLYRKSPLHPTPASE